MNIPGIILFCVIGAILSVCMACWYYVMFRSREQEVKEYLEDDQDLRLRNKKEERNWLHIFHDWFDSLAPTGKKIDLFSEPEELEKYLIEAGHPYGLTVDRLQGAKIVGFLAGLGIGFIYFILGMPLAPIGLVFIPLFGYAFPLFGIRVLAKRRQAEIQYELPDFLDMMSITLQAGMSLDTALEYYVLTSKGPLSEELARMNQEIGFGVRREVAYRDLLRRATSPDLEALVQSMIQAHNLGTPISEMFAQQAEEMRRMRAELAKEKAGKAEPKISLIGGLIIAPSIMLIIFGTFALKYMGDFF